MPETRPNPHPQRHAMARKIADAPGFIAALDQSGGSTPKALAAYGIGKEEFAGDEEMFALMHRMRARIMTAPAFTGDRIIGAILFERTMDGEIEGEPSAAWLWQRRNIVPFLKVDKGLEAGRDGVRLMKPIPGLDALLQRALGKGIFGTKMRSVVEAANAGGIADIVEQQFSIGRQIAGHGLMPILEPEVLIDCPDKHQAEAMLRAEIVSHLNGLPGERKVMLKLTLPSEPGFYRMLIDHPRVTRVVALSGGYTRDEACEKLAQNPGMIASFSRGLTEGLSVGQSDADFNATLSRAIDRIYAASAQ